MIKNKPNIFEFATKELSQDAVFMYIFDCFNSKLSKEHQIGSDFINLMFEIQNIKIKKTIKSIEIKKQYHNIDVLALINYEDNCTDAIIVEDKTYSSEHDNQLERYYDKIIKNKTINANGTEITINNVYGVYFKLGEPTLSEKNALKINDTFEYKLLPSESFLCFLNNHKNSNMLMEMIYEYYYIRLHYIHTINNTDFSNPIGLNFNEVLSNSYAQDKYLRWIMKNVIGSKYYEGNQYSVMNYGKPCTQYRFIFTKEDVNSDWDCKSYNQISKYCYFFRIDSHSKGWYITINQYDYNGNKNWNEKSKERDRIRIKVNEILEKNGVKDNTDNRGKKESKISLFNIASFDDVNNLIPVLKEIYSKVVEMVIDN